MGGERREEEGRERRGEREGGKGGRERRGEREGGERGREGREEGRGGREGGKGGRERRERGREGDGKRVRRVRGEREGRGGGNEETEVGKRGRVLLPISPTRRRRCKSMYQSVSNTVERRPMVEEVRVCAGDFVVCEVSNVASCSTITVGWTSLM